MPSNVPDSDGKPPYFELPGKARPQAWFSSGKSRYFDSLQMLSIQSHTSPG